MTHEQTEEFLDTLRLPEAIKNDDNKQRYDLLPAYALDELVKVYSMGAKKYAPRNWELGMAYSRVFAAIMRHAWAWFRK